MAFVADEFVHLDCGPSRANASVWPMRLRSNARVTSLQISSG